MSEIEDILYVGCLCDPNTLKGLGWALENALYSNRKLELFPLTLAELPGNEGRCDVYFVSVDLGQPIPVESLKRLQGKPGLAAILQPTPTQLLDCFEVPNLSAIAWDGSAFEKIISRLQRLLGDFEKSLQEKDFVEACSDWLRAQLKRPNTIQWIGSVGAEERQHQGFTLNERQALSVGAKNSNCDICLPFTGNFRVGEFVFAGGHLQFKRHANQVEVRTVGSLESLKPGDIVEIEHQRLLVMPDNRLEELATMLRRSHLLGEAPRGPGDSTPELKTAAELCRYLMTSMMTGELRLMVNSRYGSIYFIDGRIDQAFTGSVAGKKALLRMLGWANPTWRFNVDARHDLNLKNLDLNLSDFIKEHTYWREKREKIGQRLPPPQLQLRINPEKFEHKLQWTPEETMVAAAVCEYQQVSDILNYSPLEDLDILERLVSLRKEGLIEISGD